MGSILTPLIIDSTEPIVSHLKQPLWAIDTETYKYKELYIIQCTKTLYLVSGNILSNPWTFKSEDRAFLYRVKLVEHYTEDDYYNLIETNRYTLINKRPPVNWKPYPSKEWDDLV